MSQKKEIKNRSKSVLFFRLLLILPIILLGLSLLIDPYENHLLFRSLRVLVSFSFIGASISLFHKKLDKLVYLHMLFYGFASGAAIFFETESIGIICMVLNLIAFLFLIVLLFRQIEFKSISRIFLIALVLGILANIWLVYYLLIMLYDKLSSIYLLISICLSIVGSFSVSVLALIYNYSVKSISSILFTLFIVLLVFSETFRGAGYYGIVDATIGQYFARLLLIVAYMLLFSFSFHEVYRKDDDLLSKKVSSLL